MNSMMVLFRVVLVTAIIAGTHGAAFSETRDYPVNCQVIVSLMELDENAPDLDEKSYDLIFYGAAAQKPLKKNLAEYGFEVGANLSIKNDTNVLRYSAGSSGGTIRIGIDNKMLLFDYFAGGYIAVNLTKRLRLYAGGGPLLIYGRWEREPDDYDDEFGDNTQSGLSAGIYGRAGLEVAIVEKLSLGAGIRAISTGLEFNDTLGSVKVEGSQVYFHISFKI